MNVLFSKRFIKTIFGLICMLSYLRSSKPNTCASRNLDKVQKNFSLPNMIFHKLYPGGLVLCARECKYRQRCKSFNYIDDSGECQLNANSSGSIQTVPTTGVSFGFINHWPQKIAGSCANHTCKIDEKCSENGKTYICHKEYANQANNTALIGHIFEKLFAIETDSGCAVECYLRSACLSFNFQLAQQVCELNSALMVTNGLSYIGNRNGTFYSNINDYNDTVNLNLCKIRPCNQTSVCHDINSSHYTCHLRYCSRPTQPEDTNILPEFDQAAILWKIGTNLTYRCKSLFFPDTDWTCLPNATWQNPNCKAISKCSELFHNCNLSYTDGSYVFENQMQQHHMIINCYQNSSNMEYVALKNNKSFSSYHVISESNCQIQSACERQFSAVKISSVNINYFYLSHHVYKSTSDCDGPGLFKGGSNCTSNCSDVSFGEFQVDITGSGFRMTESAGMTGGNLTFNNNSQIVRGNCTTCGYCGVENTPVFLALSGDLDYTNAQRPECVARGVD